MKNILSFIALLMLAAPLHAQFSDSIETDLLLAEGVFEDDPPPSADGPQAVIGVMDGSAVPEVVKPNTVLFFTSDKATSAGEKGSILWIVTPESIAKTSKQLEFNGTPVLVVQVGPSEYMLTVHQVAIKGNIGSKATATIAVRGDGPSPGPTPPGPHPPVVETLDAALARLVATVVTDATRQTWLDVANVYTNTASIAEQGKLQANQIEFVTETTANASAKPVKVAWDKIRTGELAARLTELKNNGRLVTVSDYVGTWKLIAAGIKAGAGAQPPPDPDVDPVPVPDVAPIPVAGLHVLIVYETEDRTKMPASQVGILTSEPFQKKMDEFGAKWRIYDQHTTVNPDNDPEDKLWEDAMKRKRDSVPWIVISNGKTGFEGKLPVTADETIKLIEKYKP